MCAHLRDAVHVGQLVSRGIVGIPGLLRGRKRTERWGGSEEGKTNQPAGGWLGFSLRAREPVPHLHVALRVLKDGVPEPLVKTGRLVLVLRPEIADVAARDCTCSNKKKDEKVNGVSIMRKVQKSPKCFDEGRRRGDDGGT